MKKFILLSFFYAVSLFCASAQSDVLIESFDSAGVITFSEVSSASSYRLEWAPSAAGPWTNFVASSTVALNDIEPTQSGSISVQVPMMYRVVASVVVPTNMSLIPAGSFVMGNPFDEQTLKSVYVSAFYMDQYEVSKALWDEVKALTQSIGYEYSHPGQGVAPNHPVNSVNWYDAVRWCNARSEMEGLTPVYYTDTSFTTVYRTGEIEPYANWTANGYRLPTSAEWEKAARGGVVGQRFPWGNTITHSNANYYSYWSFGVPFFHYDSAQTAGPHPDFKVFVPTCPVDYFLPNDYGMYNIVGNQEEWCWEWWNTETKTAKIIRGGSWFNHGSPFENTIHSIVYAEPYISRARFGFRCARGL